MDFWISARCLIREGREEEGIALLAEYADYDVRHAEARYIRLNEPSSSSLLRPLTWHNNEKFRRNAKEELTDGIVNDWIFSSLQDNPRFVALMKRIGELPELQNKKDCRTCMRQFFTYTSVMKLS